MASREVLNIETTDASITTATVTIKALQVGKKQMTISVFRQLPEAPLVDEDTLALLGQPWGYVNYRWGDQRGTNFIFQSGSRLYRDCILIRDSSELAHDGWPTGYVKLHVEAEKRVAYYVYASLLEGSVPNWFKGKERNVTLDMNGCDGFKGWKFKVELDDKIKHMTGLIKLYGVDNHQVKEISKNTAHVVKQFSEIYGCEPTTQVINMMLQELSADVIRYCTRWDELMEKLRAVEQLFIAV